MATKAGRPRQSDALKKVKGTLRPGRVIKSVEHDLLPKVPTPPEYLNEYGIAEWNSKANQLQSLKMLSESDLGALSALCKEWQNYLKAEALCDKNARFYAVKDDAGAVKYWGLHPAHTVAQQHLKSYIALCNEFGMTPASRIRSLPDSGKSQNSPIFSLLKGGKTKTG